MSSTSHLRKVQLTGGSTYVVSLPKSWARSVDIKAGDHLQIIPQPDMSLLVTLKEDAQKKEGKTETVINAAGDQKPEDVAREFIACYLVGYNIIRLKLDGETSGVRSHIKETIRRKLVGVEIIEETASFMVARCLLGHVEFPVKDALSRMHTMSLSMHKDVAKALLENDLNLAKTVAERDDEVDRLYFFAVRQLKMASERRFMIEEIGLNSFRDLLGYRLIAKSIERIADHAVRIASIIPTIGKKAGDEVSDFVSKMSDIATDTCMNSMKALFQLNVKLANQAADGTYEVVKLEKKAIDKMMQAKFDCKTTMGLRLILDSIRRTAEYGTDIAEIAIHLAVKK